MKRHRVGITANPSEREDHWRNLYRTLSNWVIQARNLNYEQAQHMENEFIAKGYGGSPGGKPVPGNVYIVYTFQY